MQRMMVVAWVAVAVAACADQPKTTVGFQLGDVRTFAQWALAQGPMWIDVRGQPFAASRAELEAAVKTAATDATNWTADPRFTASADEAGVPTMRIVITFNSAIDGQGNCATLPAGGGLRPDGTVTVAASFCDGAGLMSHVNGSVDTTGGLSDPRFHALLRQVIADLLPMPARRGQGGIRMGV
jgi:hypothetical protein